MITSLRLVDFKNFADETLKLGPFTIIVGANASGKSNIRDAFRFLHGIGRGYTLAEILGGKYVAGGQLEWAPIRGAMNEIIRLGGGSADVPSTFSVIVEINHEDRNALFSMKVGCNPDGSDEFCILEEEVCHSTSLVYKSTGTFGSNSLLTFGNEDVESVAVSGSQPTLLQIFQKKEFWFKDELKAEDSIAKLAQIIENRLPWSLVVLDTLMHFNSIAFLELSPANMRLPSAPGVTKLGESGDNLPTVLKAICSDNQRREVLTSWLRELTPMDVMDFEFPRDPSGRIHVRLLERNGRRISASSASDGTLRFLGILAALLSPEPSILYFIEEIDNGIHPSRLHLLIELIERQTAKNGIQVVATTHSPEVLNLINDSTFENASIVYRDEDSADAIIRPLSEMPRVRELRKSQGLGRLHAGGWMEDILAFESADAEAVE